MERNFNLIAVHNGKEITWHKDHPIIFEHWWPTDQILISADYNNGKDRSVVIEGNWNEDKQNFIFKAVKNETN